MTTSLDIEKLKSVQINGLDVVLLLVNLTVEIVAVLSPSGDDTSEQNIVDIANRMDDFAQRVPDPRMNFLFTQVARGLIATERTA